MDGWLAGGENNAKSESDRSIDWTCSSAANPPLPTCRRRSEETTATCVHLRCAAADLPDGERKEEECVKPTAAWQSPAVELRLRRRFGTMRMKIALGGRTSAVAVAWRIRRSRLRRPCGRVRDAGDSPGSRVETLFRSSHVPSSWRRVFLPPPSVCSTEVQMSAALQTNLHRNVALDRVGETTADVSSSASVRAPAS